MSRAASLSEKKGETSPAKLSQHDASQADAYSNLRRLATGENESQSSDIVPPEQIPKKLDAKPAVTEEVFSTVYGPVLAPHHSQTLGTIVIERSSVADLAEGDRSAMIAEQFLCVICSNFVVPNFEIGRDGIKESSVRLPECRSCERVACYLCWRDHLLSDDAMCPSCSDVVEVPAAEKQELQEWATEGDEASCPEIDAHMQFLTKKSLLKMLFTLRITHRCAEQRTDAMQRAREQYAELLDGARDSAAAAAASQVEPAAGEIMVQENSEERSLGGDDRASREERPLT